MTETPASIFAESKCQGASSDFVAAEIGTGIAHSIVPPQEQQPAHGVVAKVEAMSAKNQARSQAAEPTTKAVTGTKHHHLPYWSDDVRGVPNFALRSALFGAIGKGTGRYLEREKIFALKNITISYTGAQLDQGDLSVWAAVLHLARAQPIGQECSITAYRLLQLLQLTDSGENRKTLKSRLSRLNACALKVQVGPVVHYEGNLINLIFPDEHSSQFKIRLNPGLRIMFGKDQFTKIHWGIRQSLNGHYLAQWLHGFFSSHAAPFPLKVETIHSLSGSKTAGQPKFRQLLHKALTALGRASIDHGQPFSYCIEGNLVKVEKTPSKAQKRHLDKRLN